ncbi:MAG: uncharacterized protein V7606_431 [Burkholderiales bacterium]|jgi:hypothetical protein
MAGRLFLNHNDKENKLANTEKVPVQPGPEAQYWAHVRDGKFMIQRSKSSGEYVFYPRVLAPRTGATDLEFVEVSGRAVVHSTTVVRQSPKAGGDYNLVLVQLEEGPRMVSRVVGIPPEQVKIGMSVMAHIEKVDFGTHANSEQPVVVFRAAQ